MIDLTIGDTEEHPPMYFRVCQAELPVQAHQVAILALLTSKKDLAYRAHVLA